MSAKGFFPDVNLDVVKGKIKSEADIVLDKAGIPNEPGEKPHGPFKFLLKLLVLVFILSIGALVGITGFVIWEDRTEANSFSMAAAELYGQGRQKEAKVLLEMGNSCPNKKKTALGCTLLGDLFQSMKAKGQ